MEDIEGKTSIPEPLVTMNIMGSDKYARVMRPFKFRSKILWDAVCKRTCEIPEGFVFDFESIPWLRGECPEAGAIHDYVCRIDSNPVVSKTLAAKVYFEFLEYIYAMDDARAKVKVIDRACDWIKSHVKFAAVVLAPGYFHRYKVLDSYSEIAGIKES